MLTISLVQFISFILPCNDNGTVYTSFQMTHHLHRNVHRFRPEAEDVRDEPNLLRIIEDVSQVIISLKQV